MDILIEPGEVTRLWERQPYDTEASYHAFVTYFLPQEPPRMLTVAYRRYWQEKRFQELLEGYEGVISSEIRATAQLKAQQEAADKVASGTWQMWSRGNAHGGAKIPGAVSWEKRANAYDHYQSAKVMKTLEKRRLEARIETADLGKLLRERAMIAARTLVPVTQKTQDKDGRQVVIIKTRISPGEIARLAQVGVELERLGLGESTANIEHSGAVLVGAAHLSEIAAMDSEELDELIIKLASTNDRLRSLAGASTGDGADRTDSSPGDGVETDDSDRFEQSEDDA